jgi:hypothetical protein
MRSLQTPVTFRNQQAIKNPEVLPTPTGFANWVRSKTNRATPALPMTIGQGCTGVQLVGDGADNDKASLELGSPGFKGKPASQFLGLLGKDAAKTWLRCIKPTKPGAGEHQGLTTTADRAWVNRKTADGFNLYAVIGNADSATGKGGGVTDADITTCPALFVEWDDGASIEEQMQLWQTLKLPEPSVMVATGGKSVHCYWVLSEPISAAEWKRITARLIAHCNSDKQCSNPARVMRLPGSVYFNKKTGKATGQCRILSTAGTRYSAAEIEACLPAPAKPAKPAAAPLRHDWAPRGIDEINAAAECIPRRVGGEGTYEEDRNALCGCSAALAEAGHPDPDGAALALLGHLWPSEAEARQVLESTTTREAKSYWAIAGENGFNLKRSSKTAKTVNSSSSKQQLPANLEAWILRLRDGWNEDGKSKALSPGQLAEMLPAQNFRFNELDLRAYVETSSGWRRITDADLDSAYVLLTGKGWRIGAEPVVKAVLHVARQNTVHPVREYLQRVKADPSITPYDLDQVAPKLFRASQPLHVAMVRKWLIGAVARALQPGCQMDYCLVLKGGQGLLKSTSLKALAGADWFTSSHADQEKDFLLNIHSCWIYEQAELESITSKKAAGALKNLITTATDTFRPPYGRTSERLDRQSVFCGTVNKDQFLRDDTGNRRYWVVPIDGNKQLDRAAITAARDAIWKAAVLAHEAGELPMLPKDLEALSAAQNEQYNEQDAWVEMVQAWMAGVPLHRWDPDRDPPTTAFDVNGACTSSQIIYSAGLKRPDAITKADEMRVGEVLKGLGFKRKQRRVNGRPQWAWTLSPPVTTVTTSADEVVTPQMHSGAVDLDTLSPPSPPKSSSKGLGENCSEGHTQNENTIFRTRGGYAPSSPAKSLAPQSVCPVTTSLSPPTGGGDTTDPIRAVDEARIRDTTDPIRAVDEARIRELGQGADLSGWTDKQVAELRQSLEKSAQRRAAAAGVEIPEVA